MDYSHLSWTRGLEFVLSDRPALDVFREWLTNNHSPQALELHFAMRAFERMARESDPRCSQLAVTIHQKYSSLRTGQCSFIPSRIRQEVGRRVKCLSPSSMDSSVFSPLQPFVDDFLRKQHALFVSSDEFIDAFNKMSLGEDVDSRGDSRREKRSHAPSFSLAGHASSPSQPGFSLAGHTPSFSMTSGHTPSFSLASHAPMPQLTAEALLRSRQDRENTLGESSVERLYSSSSRAPYVGRATTSHNDSAVSSSFSSDANGHNRNGQHRLRSIREEHLRGNPTTFVIPRVDPGPNRNEGAQFDHSTDEGRQIFAASLGKRLHREATRRRRNDQTARQLKDIEDRKCTARDVISLTEAGEASDDEYDLDRYEKAIREDSSIKASAQRSPRVHGGSPRPFSPDHSFRPAAFMTQSMTSYQPQFAPPPASQGFNTASYYKERSHSRTAPVYDSSGVESMAPSDASRHSKKSNGQRQERRRSRHNITIQYKGSDGVPVVAHVTSSGEMTLREFRRHFSISSHSNVQFFFKSESDDADAPYQLLLISDDHAPLPLFQGKISAELKHCSPQ